MTERWKARGVLRVITLVAAVFLVPFAAARDSGADIRVKGMGVIRDHKMRQTLLLLLGPQRGSVLGANALDDAALILFSSLTEDGYLEPSVTLHAQAPDGTAEDFALDPTFEKTLPRRLKAASAVFLVKRGRRYVISEVQFEGLTALPAKQARAFFRSEGTWLSLGSERPYSPDRLKRSAGNLLEELRRKGRAEAAVETGEVRMDHKTGRVTVTVRVTEGPRWIVRGLRFQIADQEPPPPDFEKNRVGKPWSSLWRQDAETTVRRWFYQRGRPDVHIEVAPDAAVPKAGERSVTAVIRASPGPLVRLGAVRFEGNQRTRESILRPLVRVKPGEPLNPLALEEAQFRLSHLGVFRGIDLAYDPPTGTTRDAVFNLRESNRQEFDLLWGWGSFDQLRGGVELHNTNLFGLAHSSMLQLVQSMKGTKGEYDYTVPELFGTSVDGTARLFGLRRQERAFLAEEYGGTLSVAWPLRSLGLQATTGYTFERLKNLNDTLATFRTDQGQANAASLNFGVTRDRLDNTLDPHHGYKVFLRAVEASRNLGGQVDFQQFEWSASYHTGWGTSRWIHLGVTHDLLTTLGARNDIGVPVNVRFYPGGDQSIRGYGLGEAAPRGPDGRFIGAKSVILLNAELEQGLTSKISLVLFSDTLGAAATLRRYPFGERLYSVGLGLRYRTLIGPIRLEYGRNLNPRPLDPSGALLFSVGFPF